MKKTVQQILESLPEKIDKQTDFKQLTTEILEAIEAQTGVPVTNLEDYYDTTHTAVDDDYVPRLPPIAKTENGWEIAGDRFKTKQDDADIDVQTLRLTQSRENGETKIKIYRSDWGGRIEYFFSTNVGTDREQSVSMSVGDINSSGQRYNSDRNYDYVLVSGETETVPKSKFTKFADLITNIQLRRSSTASNDIPNRVVSEAVKNKHVNSFLDGRTDEINAVKAPKLLQDMVNRLPGIGQFKMDTRYHARPSNLM